MIGVPLSFRAALATIARLESTQVAKIADSLKDQAIDGSMQRVTNAIQRAGVFDEANAESVAEALLSLALQRTFRQWKPERISKAVATSDDLDLNDSERKCLEKSLTLLLEPSALTVAAKTADLLTEYEHKFASSRIVTDIRPVWEDDVEARPSGAVLTGSLRIDFFGQREFRTMYFGVTAENLRELRDTADRALGKLTTLQGLLDQSGLTQLHPDEDDEPTD